MLPPPPTPPAPPSGPIPRWRSLGVALGISTIGFVLFVAMLAADAGAWRTRGVLASPRTHFMDLGIIFAGARCASQGVDVLVANPCDPFGRPMNYPRVWIWLSDTLGLTHASPVGPGLVLAGLFFLSAAFLPRIHTFSRGLIWLLAILSPAISLAVERGNTDLVLFILAVPGLAFLGRGTGAKHTAGLALLLAAILKLFPGIGLLVLPTKRFLGRLGWVYLALFLGYLGAIHRDVAAIAKVIPHDPLLSFGGENTIVLFSGLILQIPITPSVAVPLGRILAVGLIGLGLYLGRRGARPPEQGPPNRRPHLLYGALLYLGSFTLGSNYDYRLMVLLLVLPTALDAADGRFGERARRLGGLCATLVLLALWSGGVFPPISPTLSWLIGLLDLVSTPLLACALTALVLRIHAPSIGGKGYMLSR